MSYKALFFPTLLILLMGCHSPMRPGHRSGPAVSATTAQNRTFADAWRFDERNQKDSCAHFIRRLLDQLSGPRRKDSLLRYLSLYLYNLPPAEADSVAASTAKMLAASPANGADLLLYRNAIVRWLLRNDHLPEGRKLADTCRLQIERSSGAGLDSAALAGFWENKAQIFARVGASDSALLMGQKCLNYYRQHAALYPDKLLSTHNILGVIYKDLVRTNQSQQEFDSSYYWMKATGRAGGYSEGMLYMNKGAGWLNIGEFDKAKESYDRSIPVWANMHDTLELGIISYNTGLLYYQQYDFEKALQYARLAEKYMTRVLPPHDPELLLPETQLAIVSDELGDTLNAARYLREMDRIRKDIFQPDDINYLLGDAKIAAHYAKTGRLDTAIHLYQAILKKMKRVEPIEGESTDDICYDLATDCYQDGDYKKAYTYYSLCAEREKKIYGPRQIFTLYTIDLAAECLKKMKRNTQAAALLIPLCQTMNEQIQSGQLGQYANSFYKWQIPFSFLENQAILYPDNPDSLKKILHGLEIIEPYAQNYLRQLTGSLNKDKQSQYDSYYSLALRICYTLHTQTGDTAYLGKAFEYSEKKKEMPLRLALKERLAQHFAGMPDSLVKKEEDLSVKLAYTEKNYEAAQSDGDSAGMAIYNKLLAETQTMLDQLIESFGKDHSQYYALKYDMSAATLPACQRYVRLLDKKSGTSDAAYLQYISAGDSIYCLLVTDSVTSFYKLADERTIDLLADSCHDALLHNKADVYKRVAFRLYQLLCLPLSSHLAPGGRLVISAEKKLQDLSWEGLLRTDKGNNYDELDYLLRHYLITYSPGITTLSYQEQLRSFNKTATGSFISFAPGFTQQERQTVFNNTHDSAYIHLIRQPWAQSTAEATAQLFNGRSYTGLAATNDVYFDQAAHAGILHFGTHAVWNDRNPMLSRLYLATVKKDPDEGLYTYDIFAHPTSAKLAVLAACQTGVTSDDPGLGRISLAKAFSFAGCPSQVMTLWDVDDQATASLMEDFYTKVHAGRPVAAALQEAKLDLLRTQGGQGWANPYYWSGVVYFGEDDIVLPASGGSGHIRFVYQLISLLLLAAILLLFIRYRKRSS